MKTTIDVELTYEQVKALDALGMMSLKDYIDDYIATEHRIRTNICRIDLAACYVNKNSGAEFFKLKGKLEIMIADLEQLLEDKMVEKFYFRKEPEQRQRLVSAYEHAEYLYKKLDTMNTDERIKSYPQRIVTYIDEFMQFFE